MNGVYSTQSISGAYSAFTGQNATTPINAYFAYINLDSTAQGGSNPTQYANIALDFP